MEAMQKKLGTANRMITCRICEGNHYTTRCPYKDTFTGVLPGAEDVAGVDGPDASAPGATNSSGKYVPPSMRGGRDSTRGGESMYKDSRGRDDLPTLRVTNLSEDANEDDLREIFRRFEHFGKVARIFVGRDQETGLCKGFAFVSYEDRRDAEKAMGKVHGLPYDHLILACQWSGAFRIFLATA
jgi:translation initiation factor 3 subunit G